MTYHCLDLFSGLGGFSQAFQESDLWRVTTIDIQERFQPDIQADVMTLRPTDLLDRGIDPDLILASPPCTEFSLANVTNNHFTKGEPHTPEAKESVLLAYHAVGLIKSLNPQYWFLENPRGQLRQVLDREPEATVTYCQYGLHWMKPTDLWGEHPPGFEYRSCSPGDPCHENTGVTGHTWYDENGETVNDSAERAKVPAELSQQIHDVVTDALNHTPPQQTTLTAAAPDGGDA